MARDQSTREPCEGERASGTACGGRGDLALPQGRELKWLRIAIGLVAGTMIECAAAAVMLWHLFAQIRGVDGEELEQKQKIVRRFIGGTFIALAIYILIDAGWTWWKAETPEHSPIGIALAAASLIVMPAISIAKLRAARELGSSALRAEAKETLVCSYLSFALLLGLLANALIGWWWADSLAALLMVPWLIKEGSEGLRGDACCDED